MIQSMSDRDRPWLANQQSNRLTAEPAEPAEPETPLTSFPTCGEKLESWESLTAVRI